MNTTADQHQPHSREGTAATTALIKPFCVLDVAVTQTVGFYDTREEADDVAHEWGGSAFTYELTDEERQKLAEQRSGTFHNVTGTLPSRDGQHITVLCWGDEWAGFRPDKIAEIQAKRAERARALEDEADILELAALLGHKIDGAVPDADRIRRTRDAASAACD